MYSEKGEMGIGALIMLTTVIIVSMVAGATIFHVLNSTSNTTTGTSSNVSPYVTGTMEISHVYGIMTPNGISGLVLDAHTAPTVNSVDMRYITISLLLNGGMRRFTLSPNVSSNDDYYSALNAADANHYSVYLAYRSPDSGWDPSNGSYVVSSSDRVEIIIANEKATSEYYLPFVSTTLGPSATSNYVIFDVQQDDTVIKIDENDDGVFDLTLHGNAGDVLRWGGSSSSTFPVAGAHIVSNKPVDVYYRYAFEDWGAYEDGTYSYTLLSTNMWGKNYYIPIEHTWTSIVSDTNQNEVYVDTNGDGHSDYTKTLDRGSTWTLQSLPAGTHVWSRYPVGVAIINRDHGYYDNTSATTLLPTSLLGNEYFVPKEHGYVYENSRDLTKVYIEVTSDDTKVYVDSNGDGKPDRVYTLNAGQTAYYSQPAEGARIYANRPFYAIYRFDIYGEDPWAGIYRHYTHEFELLPGSSSVSNLIVPISGDSSYHVASGNSFDLINAVSYRNDNEIKIDYQSDGTIDRTDTVSYGGIVYYGPEYTSNSVATIYSSGAVFYKAHVGWWDQISDTTCARAIYITGTHSLSYAPMVSSGEYVKIFLKNTVSDAQTSVGFQVSPGLNSNDRFVLLYSSGK